MSYRIAFFTTDWNYELVSETLAGVCAYLDTHKDLTVQVFDCFGLDEGSIKDKSVYEIYNLVDLDQYDGVVVQTHQIVYKDALQELSEKLHLTGVPAVSIGTSLGDLPQVNTDDYAALREITSHVIEEHQAERLWFLTGNEENGLGEAFLRRQGFLEACKEHGIPEDHIRILNGNWRTYTGEAAARAILASADRPRALICANDEMALGAISTLQEGGLRVPEDVIVTGYDDTFSSSLSSPRLSTINRNFQDLAMLALGTLIRIIEGEQVPSVSYNHCRPVYASSCGCLQDEAQEALRIRQRFFAQSRFLRSFYLSQDKMAMELFDASSLGDVMNIVEKYYTIFGCDNVYICLNDFYFDCFSQVFGRIHGYDRKDPSLSAGDLTQYAQEDTFSGEYVLTACGKTSLQPDENHAYLRVLPEDIPNKKVTGSAPLCIYYPLRYNTTMIGFLTMVGASSAADLNLHESIINLIVLAIENVRKKQVMIQLNSNLRALYVTDQLTGLNNRFGTARYGQPLFDSLTGARQRIRFLFLDIDNMKTINDCYGHEYGDKAIRLTADVLRAVSGPDDYLMRYGGDEFIGFGKADSRDLRALVQQELDRLNAEDVLPFSLEVSVGEYITEADTSLTLDRCLQEADQQMYQIKKNKKGSVHS